MLWALIIPFCCVTLFPRIWKEEVLIDESVPGYGVLLQHRQKFLRQQLERLFLGVPLVLLYLVIFKVNLYNTLLFASLVMVFSLHYDISDKGEEDFSQEEMKVVTFLTSIVCGAIVIKAFM